MSFKAASRHLPSLLCSRGIVAISILALFSSTTQGQMQFADLDKVPLPKSPYYYQTSAIVVGDVDADGDADLVCGQSTGQRLYLNDGQGRFVDATPTTMSNSNDQTFALALGDVDGDGDSDLVCGNAGQNKLYLNDGKGKFTDGTVTRMPRDSDHTTSLLLVDVDRDGDLDLVCGNTGTLAKRRQNKLYLNDGKGRFTDVTASRLPKDMDATGALALGDIDGDGDSDLIFGNGGQNKLYLNDGKGKFTDATATRLPKDMDGTGALALGDIDGDGDLDLVCGNSNALSGAQNKLYLNGGKGKFTDVTAQRMPRATNQSIALVLGDVDGDGDLDLIFGNHDFLRYGQQDMLYLNDGKGKFTNATATRLPKASDETHTLALGDVDGDSDLDLVSGIYGTQSRLYLNDGKGRFTDAVIRRMPTDSDVTVALAMEDVDGDGDLDLFLGNRVPPQGLSLARRPQVTLYLNDGKGRFRNATTERMPKEFAASTFAMVLGDVDRDGDPDLICDRDNLVKLYLNDGKGRFTDATATRMPKNITNTFALALTDVDGDGDLDLVCGTSGQNMLYLNNGKGRFTDVTASRLPKDMDWTGSLAHGDVDGDGDQDIVLGSARGKGGQNKLYLNDGKGKFTDATATRMPKDGAMTAALVLGDVDGDGDLDLFCGNAAWRYPVDRQNRLYLNNGKGKFTDATATQIPKDSDLTWDLALGDVDGDGDPDLVCGNEGRNKLYLNDGKGRFVDATTAKMAKFWDYTGALVLRDVDRDGDLDVLCGNYLQNKIYVNLQRQIDAPYRAISGRTYRLDIYARSTGAQNFRLAIPFVADAERKTLLPPIGIWGLHPSRMIALSLLVIPGSTRMVSVAFPIPNNAGLIGRKIYSQAIMLPSLTSPAIRLRFTNTNADTILRL